MPSPDPKQLRAHLDEAKAALQRAEWRIRDNTPGGRMPPEEVETLHTAVTALYLVVTALVEREFPKDGWR